MLVMFFSFPLRKDSKQLGEAVSTFFFYRYDFNFNSIF